MFKRYLKWLIGNGLFVGLFLYSHETLNENLMNVAVFSAWLISALSLFFLSDRVLEDRVEKYKQGLKFVNKNVDTTLEIFIIGMIVYYGYFWLAIAYVIRAFLLYGFKIEVDEISKKENIDV